MAAYFRDRNGQLREWHIGEPLPEAATYQKVVTGNFDGDERDALIEALQPNSPRMMLFEVGRYVSQLEPEMQKVYVECSQFSLRSDTLSDDFQITSAILRIFTRYAARQKAATT